MLAMSDTSQLLQSLHDIQEPLPPTTAIPWWLILTLVFVSVSALAWQLMRKRTHQDWRATLITELSCATTLPTEQARLHLARTLRSVARIVDGAEVNALEGEAWLQPLDHQFNTQYFTTGNGQTFGAALYKAEHSNPACAATLTTELTSLVKQWRPKKETYHLLADALESNSPATIQETQHSGTYPTTQGQIT